MFITKKHISRSYWSRAAQGVAVSLPFLNEMVPRHTSLAATAAAPKPRLWFFYFPHGRDHAEVDARPERARFRG